MAAMQARIRAVQGDVLLEDGVDALIPDSEAQADRRPTLTSVVSESLPHLKKGRCVIFVDLTDA